MALTKIPRGLLDTGIADSSDATAITIDSSENVILSSNLTMPGGSNVTWGTSYPALGNIPNSQTTLLGNNIKAGATNNTIIRHANGTDAGTFIGLTYNKGVTFHTGIATTQNSEVAETTNERMRIDATGKVGIGVTNPDYPLEVNGSNVSSGGGLATFGIFDTGTAYNGTNPGGGIAFRGKYNNAGSLTNFATVQGIKENTTDGNYATALRFTTRANGGNLTEKLRISSAGNVGIGTTSPPKKVSISALDNGTSFGSNLMLQLIGTSTTDDSRVGLGFTGNLSIGNALAIIEGANDDQSTGNTSLHMHTYSGSWNEDNLVLKAGKVGIGIATPTHKFHVVDGNNYAVLGDTQSNSTMSLRMADTAAYPVEIQAHGNDLRFNTATSANATPSVKMLLEYTGYVGIGETDPDNKLHITGGDWNNAHIKIERTDVGGSNDAGLVLKAAAGANDAYGLGGIWFQNALDNNAYALIRARTDDASGTSGKLEFVTSSSAVGNGTYAAMTIKATGYVGIGGQSPANRLHIFGDSGDSRMQFTNSSSGNAYADGLWVGMDNTQAYILQRENLPVGIYTNATRRLVIEAGGAVVPEGDGTQNLGSASKRWDNIYVNDMHFSNEGSDGNDVDGTTGNWTLQEGEEYLYVINNKSGKKFKFSLEEIE